ncbi:MAG: ribose transport system permease protein [Solirubrobacteraceae bacterium]|nr:ribose transport system permease protein [Solirubrobacteraceae bacterium]
MVNTTTDLEPGGPPAPAGAGGPGPARGRRQLARIRGEGWGDVLFVPAVLLALVVYLSLANEFFLTSINVTNIFIQASILAIVAFGLTFVIIAGELDLSVGSGVALVSVIAAMVMRDSGSMLLGILAGIGLGLGIGLVNGLIVTRLEVPSFIATLGMLTIAHGVALALTDGAVVSGVPVGLGDLVNEGLLGIRWVLWLVLVVFAALYFLQNQTVFGARVFAVGGNREASRLSAIPVDRIRLLTFVISGITVGIAGIVLTARVQSGQPNAGGLLALTAIAAIVVGGTNLLGGRGSITRTLWGVLLISVLENGLQLEGVNDDLRQVIIGAVFIAAASVEFFRRQMRRRGRAIPVAAGPAGAPPEPSAEPAPAPEHR